MSKNNTIRKSDKKFIRTEKARIRQQFSDAKKQEELINNLYKRFEKQSKAKPDKSQKHFDGPVTIPPKADLVGEIKPAKVKKPTVAKAMAGKGKVVEK